MKYKKDKLSSTFPPPFSSTIRSYERSLSEEVRLHKDADSSTYESLKPNADDSEQLHNSNNNWTGDLECVKRDLCQLLNLLNISSPEELRMRNEKLKTTLALKKFKKEIDEVVKDIETKVHEQFYPGLDKRDSEERLVPSLFTNTIKAENLTIRKLCELRSVPDTIAIVYSKFELLLYRLSSLSDFSPGVNISLCQLASAGFYKPDIGEGKTTKCYSCGVVYDKWKSGDDPMAIHKMLNSTCSVVKEADASKVQSSNSIPYTEPAGVGNIGSALTACNLDINAAGTNNNFQTSSLLKNEPRICNVNTNKQNSSETEFTHGTSHKNKSSISSEEDHHGQATASSQAQQPSDFESLGIFTDKLKYPNYASIQSRIRSYKGWPSYLDQTAQQMSEAGFLFAGYHDYTRCFSCGGGLRNWEAGDDPWVEHARWFPKCSYLRQNKSDTFIDAVQRKHKEIMDNEKSVASNNGRTPTSQNQPNESSQSRSRISDNNNRLDNLTTLKNSSLNVATRSKETGSRYDILQTVAVRSVLEMGYKIEEIMGALEKLRQLGKDESRITATDIMRILLGDDLEVESNSETLGASANPTSVAESSNQIEVVPNLDNTKLLLEENKQLKDQRLCKVCLDFDATIAFLPCGHIVCCIDCAPAMRKCPMCRTYVKGTIKTYLA